MHGNDPVTISKQVAELDINNGLSNPSGLDRLNEESSPPPPPRLSSTGIVVNDITRNFIDAAQKLSLGQLVIDPFFALFESVGALEIMDPKMDSGCLKPNETMEDDYDYTKQLLPEEVMGVIDQLLLHEMAWHMGHPLSQTVFTSLYIDRILSLSPNSLLHARFDRINDSGHEPLCHQILRAYCLGLMKTCFFVADRIRSEQFYEEEDFVSHIYHRSLIDKLETDAVHKLLNLTIDLTLSANTIAMNVKEALANRLRFRASFLNAVRAAEIGNLIEGKRVWDELHAHLPHLQISAALGKAVPGSFSTKLQRKLASTVPPRPMVRISQQSAYGYLERLCRDGAIVVEVLQYDNPHSLLSFVSLFQSQKPQPSVYIRALLQHYILDDMVILGKMSIRQLLDDDLKMTVLPANDLLDKGNDEIELPTDSRFQIAQKMENFRSKVANAYIDILRTMCQNRCRMRRTLCHAILDWDSLQVDAEELDQDLLRYTKEMAVVIPSISQDPILSFSLSSWTYLHKLCQMEHTVQMGFELQVYQPDELAGMYWYLHYLSKTRSRHLERIKGFVLRSYKALQSVGPNMNTPKQVECLNALAFINLQMLESTSTFSFADALSCLFIVLNRLCLIPSPPRPYSNDTLRYEVRMKPFLNIGLPEVVSFDDFTYQARQPEETSLDLLEFACKALASAKKGFEALSRFNANEAFCQGSHESWVRNVKQCLKACISTSISVSAVKQALECAGKEEMGKVEVMSLGIEAEIPIGSGYHDWWIVPRIISS